jgi:hypothetical protein
MALIHITSKDNWEKIQQDGCLRPKKSLVPNATGGNVDKVSVFAGVDTQNRFSSITSG